MYCRVDEKGRHFWFKDGKLHCYAPNPNQISFEQRRKEAYLTLVGIEEGVAPYWWQIPLLFPIYPGKVLRYYWNQLLRKKIDD